MVLPTPSSILIEGKTWLSPPIITTLWCTEIKVEGEMKSLLNNMNLGFPRTSGHQNLTSKPTSENTIATLHSLSFYIIPLLSFLCQVPFISQPDPAHTPSLGNRPLSFQIPPSTLNTPISTASKSLCLQVVFSRCGLMEAR